MTLCNWSLDPAEMCPTCGERDSTRRVDAETRECTTCGEYAVFHRLLCRLCSDPATRMIDSGPDGVALYCDAHDASEVEPLALSPIDPLLGGVPLYALNNAPDVDDEVSITTFAGFMAANTDPVDKYCYLSDETRAAVFALQVGETFDGDQGAAGTWTLTRIT